MKPACWEAGMTWGASLSARRAWIETYTAPTVREVTLVALRKEGVD